jgi:hypothetical protein
MTIGFGTWLGPYKVPAPPGAGGMGEVHHAFPSATLPSH